MSGQLARERFGDRVEDLRVCGTCFGLYDAGPTSMQLCSCAPREAHKALSEATYRAKGTHWTRVAELCRCCGAEVLSTPHQFALWFCPTCEGLAREVNLTQGYCAIPIGWHSIVNDVLLPARQLRSRPGATAGADQLNAFFRQSGNVWERGRRVVERHWRKADLPAGERVPVGTYLDAVWAAGVDKSQLFDELLTARGIPGRSPAPDPPPTDR